MSQGYLTTYECMKHLLKFDIKNAVPCDTKVDIYNSGNGMSNNVSIKIILNTSDSELYTYLCKHKFYLNNLSSLVIYHRIHACAKSIIKTFDIMLTKTEIASHRFINRYFG